jgi:hypothetical protein
MSRPTKQHPWYREPWVWLLMLPPGAAVLSGSTMLYLAIHIPNALVVEDYSRIEEITRADYEQERRAAELGLSATIQLQPAGGSSTRIEVALDGADLAPPRQLSLRLRHVTRADADRVVQLHREAALYVGTTELAVGRYDLELAPPDSAWRLAGPLARVAGTLRIEARARD